MILEYRTIAVKHHAELTAAMNELAALQIGWEFLTDLMSFEGDYRVIMARYDTGPVSTEPAE